MAAVDVSEGARELVDLSAEAVGVLGDHLRQIGELIAESTQPPKLGAPRSTARKVRDKLDLYKAYCDDVARRKAEIERKTAEDFERIRAWRRECGTEGATIVEELQKLYDKVREQKMVIEAEQQKVADEQAKVQDLLAIKAKRESKIRDLWEEVVSNQDKLRLEKAMRAACSSWLQCSFDNIRFKFKVDQENEKLKIEHHRRLRKAAAQRRLDVIKRESQRRLLQHCVLALQEEQVERRAERLLEELRRRFEDSILILTAQLAQALGDEEKAKELVAEQMRRMEEEKKKAKEAERAMKVAQKDAREARKERDKAIVERDRAIVAKEEADEAREEAEAESAECRERAKKAEERAEEFKEAMIKAERFQRDLEDLLRKKNRKIANLQRMLAEVGAESDSDAPPDERPPAFLVNEDGKKVPRPRTRKERMAMAYREAESARWELRLGMAAMVDKEVANKATIERLTMSLDTSDREVTEVRWANQELHRDLLAARAAAKQPQVCPVCGDSEKFIPASASDLDLATHAPLPVPPNVPLAPSAAAAPLWSPARPIFAPAGDQAGGSPRLLKKTVSQPLFMPALTGVPPPPGPIPERLAPLRKLKRPAMEWRVGWH